MAFESELGAQPPFVVPPLTISICYSDLNCVTQITDLITEGSSCSTESTCEAECFSTAYNGKSSKYNDGNCVNNLAAESTGDQNNLAAESSGDPHMKTWSGLKYDYHGECDLIAAEDDNFSNGLGFHLHLRTTREHHYSFVSEVALQIGDEILEVDSLGGYKLNGILGEMTNTTTSIFSGFDFSHHHDSHFSQFNIKFDENSFFELWTHENLIYTKVSGKVFEGSMGMYGDGKDGKMLGRDSNTEITNPNEFADEWQVRDTDRKLFQYSRPPQFPDPCLLPNKFVPRLGEKNAMEQAKKWCNDWEGDKDECVFDVVATRNVKLADLHQVQKKFTLEQEELSVFLDEQKNAVPI